MICVVFTACRHHCRAVAGGGGGLATSSWQDCVLSQGDGRAGAVQAVQLLDRQTEHRQPPQPCLAVIHVWYLLFDV